MPRFSSMTVMSQCFGVIPARTRSPSGFQAINRFQWLSLDFVTLTRGLFGFIRRRRIKNDKQNMFGRFTTGENLIGELLEILVVEQNRPRLNPRNAYP